MLSTLTTHVPRFAVNFWQSFDNCAKQRNSGTPKFITPEIKLILKQNHTSLFPKVINH